MDKTFVLIDGNKGIYQGQELAKIYRNNDGWSGANKYDLERLLNGPDDEAYWDALNMVMDEARWTDKDGVEYKLWQDGDIFLYSGNGDQWL